MELGMIGWRRMLRGNHRVDSAKSWPLCTRDTAGAGELPSLVKEGWLRPSTKCREATIAGAAGVVCKCREASL
jgi:hypothetical protein